MNINITKTCEKCNFKMWIRYDAKTDTVLNEFNCPMCNEPHLANEVIEQVKEMNVPYVDTNSGIKGRDWHKGLSSDYKEFKRQIKRRHNNGDNNLPTY